MKRLLGLGVLGGVLIVAVWSLAQPTIPVTITGVGGSSAAPSCMLGGVSVKDFGAVGDNVTDDTPAIQAAIDSVPAGSLLCLPRGTYKVTSTLSLGTKKLDVYGASPLDGGTQLQGSINGPLLDTSSTGTARGVSLAHLYVRNTHATGIAIKVGNFTMATIRDATVSGFRGIIAESNTFTLLIDGVRVLGSGNVPGSIGVYTGGHTTILASDFQGWDEAIRMAGQVNVLGCRLEVNRTGLVVGQDLAGATNAVTGLISGLSFEANTTAIRVHQLNHGIITGVGMFGSTTAPGGESQYGLDVRGSTDATIQSVGTSGRFGSAAIKVSGVHLRGRMSGVQATNSIATAKTWDVTSPLSAWVFEQTNFSHRGDGSTLRHTRDQAVMSSLAQLSHMEPPALGKNLRGKNVAVTAAATTLAVVFQTAKNSGQTTFTATPQQGGGTLAAGTYYYLGTIVTEAGETGGTGEQTVTVTAPNNQVQAGFGGISGPLGWRRRLYRGTATGVYDGYFELPMNSNTYVDTGAAFTGLKSPPGAGADTDTSMQEPDANYAVLATPNWGTTAWVTNKATTGFTLNFGTAAPAGATIDWFILR